MPKVLFCQARPCTNCRCLFCYLTERTHPSDCLLLPSYCVLCPSIQFYTLQPKWNFFLNWKSDHISQRFENSFIASHCSSDRALEQAPVPAPRYPASPPHSLHRPTLAFLQSNLPMRPSSLIAKLFPPLLLSFINMFSFASTRQWKSNRFKH